MGNTIVEKILAKAASKQVLKPGDVAVCCPDVILQTDMGPSISGSWYRPKKVFDPDRIVQIFDHAVPAPTIKSAAGMVEARRFAKQFGVKHTFDVGAHGICHVIAAEHGFARPGELLVCSDSHTCAAGAFNCAGRGVGFEDLLQAITKGVVWYPVTPTVRYEFSGVLPPVVSGKDVFFHIAQTYGAHTNTSLEFGGIGLSSLDISARRTIATMCAELGAEFAIFESDRVTADYFDRLNSPINRALTPIGPDEDAEYLDVRQIDLGEIEPYVILPHSVPKNGSKLSAFAKKVKIDQAFVGSCANGQIEDLREVARVLRGRKVSPGVRFLVTPGSQGVYLQAAREGILTTIVEAGAVVTNSTCGACFGGHMGLVGPGEVCITASTRNFKGRMGSADAEIYMGSPATVAASAVAGEIADPRTLPAL
ncbi:MAG: aconitase/3-isopropylmalate dehydratase large subunit family protein [Burkholderiales bacterium]